MLKWCAPAKPWSGPDLAGTSAPIVCMRWKLKRDWPQRELGAAVILQSEIRTRDRLAQTLDSAQIIEGRVVAVGEARNGRLYLNFGLNWRTDFTVSLNRADRERF